MAIAQHMTQQKFHDYGGTKSMKFNVNIGYNATRFKTLRLEYITKPMNKHKFND